MQEQRFTDKDQANREVKALESQGFRLEIRDGDEVVMLKERRRIPWIIHLILLPVAGLGILTGLVELIVGPRRQRVRVVYDRPVKIPKFDESDPILIDLTARYGQAAGRRLFESQNRT